MGKNNEWTQEELNILEELYRNRNTIDIKDAYKDVLNRSYNSILGKANKMNLSQKYPKISKASIDISGNKYNKLYVNYQIGMDDRGHMLYNCTCDCGTTDIIANNYKLVNGYIKSCGCQKAISCSNNFKKYNKFDLSGEYGIGYTSKGQKFLFDLEDYDKIKELCWNIDKQGYVETRNRNNQIEQMHRLILGISRNPKYDGYDVDHIGGKESRFDNRKSNLRIATRSQNNMNKGLQSNNTSGASGVQKRGNKWVAQIWVNNVRYELGHFNNKNDAIKARKEA